MTKYRKDIDGLRAFAVLFVMAFHVNERVIPGGFVGVDMFFVISGYLITGIIVRERSLGGFSYVEFYRRRLRRILPAMFLVTLCTWAAGMLLMLPQDVKNLSWSAIATALSAANLYLTYFLDTSYFAADSATVPLLHMWSLGVEEQFYLVWPTTLLLLLRWPRLVVPALALIIFASIGVGEWHLRSGLFDLAYYMLPARAFQLVAGGLLVFIAFPRSAFAIPAALVGAVLCLGSAFLLDAQDPFPGLSAVPVTLGTCLLIVAGRVANPVSRALSFSPLRWIGLISYSLYLWHWPVLAFQRYIYGELTPNEQIGSLVAMFALAIASYHWVEKPARQTEAPFFKVAIRSLVAPCAVTLGVCFWAIITNGFGPFSWTHYPELLAATPSVKPASRLPYVCQKPKLTPTDLENKDCIVGPGSPQILLYGDSNAAHYVGVLGALAKEAGVSFRNFAHSSCPPLLGDPTPFVQPRLADDCLASLELARPLLATYQVVALGGSWKSYVSRGRQEGVDFEARFEEFVSWLTGQGIEVLLLEHVPTQPQYDARCAQKAHKINWLDCSALMTAKRNDDPFNASLHRIASMNQHVTVVSVASTLCSNEKCRAFDGEMPLYFDTGHLDGQASWRVGELYLKQAEASDALSVLKGVWLRNRPEDASRIY